MPRYCSFCGAKLREDGNFCEGCGRKTVSVKDWEKEIENDLRKKLTIEIEQKIRKEIEEEKRLRDEEKEAVEITPLNWLNTAYIFGFSLILAVGLIALSIIIGVIALGANYTSGFNIKVGFPLGWLQLTGTGVNISNWLYLFVDFIIYTIICFSVYLSYNIYKDNKQKQRKNN
ncbi:MAG: hypothetical protein FK734_19905 [Asgard group archaeon]|nr:hypothetical protein [Asgard group archaeon]